MNKVVITIISIIIIITGITIGVNMYETQKYESRNNSNNNERKIAEVTEEIYDDCTDEWESIEREKQNQTLQVNSAYEKEEKNKYVVRNKDGFVAIFKVEDGKEIEYDVTDISTDYLTQEDKENLNNGIVVEGEESLNKLIEDFE